MITGEQSKWRPVGWSWIAPPPEPPIAEETRPVVDRAYAIGAASEALTRLRPTAGVFGVKWQMSDLIAVAVYIEGGVGDFNAFVDAAIKREALLLERKLRTDSE